MTKPRRGIARSLSRSFSLCVLLASTTSTDAADLTGAEITKLISGNTLYMEFVAANVNTGAGAGLLVYTVDGKVTSKFPNGQSWKGTWLVKDNTSCITWESRPPNPCTRYDKVGDITTLINMADGRPRGTITKVAPGNPEKL
jgi:hypothetical protein